MTLHAGPQIQELVESLQASFRVYELELKQSPIFVAVAMPLWPAVTGLRPRLPAGRGMSAAQAMMSAAAEAVELLASLAQNASMGRAVFSQGEGHSLVAVKNLNGGPDQRVAAQRVYLDWAAVSGEAQVFDADSNGCASGISWDDALGRAVLECIERDAMATWWYGRQSRCHLPLACLDGVAPRLSWWLGLRPRKVMLIDITSDIGVPVVAAVSHESSGGRVAMGCAAAANVEAAALSAVTEMIQMEVSMAMGPPDAALEQWLSQASVHNMRQFHPNPHVSAQALAVADPLLHVLGAGQVALAIDLTRKQDLLTTVRVITPGLSAVHRQPDHARIITQSRSQPQFGGIRDLADIETLEPY